MRLLPRTLKRIVMLTLIASVVSTITYFSYTTIVGCHGRGAVGARRDDSSLTAASFAAILHSLDPASQLTRDGTDSLFFTANPSTWLVTFRGEQLHLFEFQSENEAYSQSLCVDRDGNGNGKAYIDFFRPVGWYKQGHLIISHNSWKNQVFDFLTASLGAPFAGQGHIPANVVPPA